MERTHPPVRRRAPARLALACALSVPVLLAGCGQAEDAARGAASDAASSARSAASSAASSAAGGLKKAATDRVVRELCDQTTGNGALADVRLTDNERAAAGRLASAASAAGVSQRYVDPLRQVAESSDQQRVADAVTALREACQQR
jgi:hypothetical protein